MLTEFRNVEAEIFSEDMDQHLPLIFKEEMRESKHNYKLTFDNKRNDDLIIYLIVNPLQPNALLQVKVSTAFVSDTIFWVFVIISIFLCLFLLIFGV